MKNALYLLIAILLLTTGCNRPTPTTLCNELLQAEELMYPAPDSALHILQGMTPPADELNRATWALLLTQAKYKCFVDQSDSLVNIAYDCFMQGDCGQYPPSHRFCLCPQDFRPPKDGCTGRGGYCRMGLSSVKILPKLCSHAKQVAFFL